MVRDFSHGKNSYLEINSQDISDACKTVGFPREADTAETSAFGTSDKTYVPGMKDGKLPFGGMFDPTLDSQLEALLATATTFVYGPQGDAPGAVKYSGAGILTKYEVAGTTSDMVSAQGELQCSGAIDRSTFS